MNIKTLFISLFVRRRDAARGRRLARGLSHILFWPLAVALPAAARPADETLQSLWDHATLYEAESGPVRHLALSGRLQGETTWFDADEGDFDDTLWRRFRFGFTTAFSRHWAVRLEADIDLNESHEDWYNRLTDAHIDWSDKASGLQVKVLKQSAGFTLDGATSSKKLYTLQRNNLTNNLWFTAEYFTGISAAGTSGDSINYKVGVFSSDGDDEIGVSEASYFTLASLDYDLTGQTGIAEAKLQLDYVYNDEDEEANTRNFSQVVSLSSQWQAGDWHLRTDLAWGDGHLGQSDLWGLVIMPMYDFNTNWQAVWRYTYLGSESNSGIRLNRYEREIVDGTGDNYHEFYAGLNIFLFGHKLKWQTGLQYTRMDGDNTTGAGEYDGWGFTTGPRMSW